MGDGRRAHVDAKLKEQVLAIAAGMLEISPEDLEILDGVVTPEGVPHEGCRSRRSR